ncbi:MAG: Ribosome maturation factor RimM [Catillopecten margaritatus gill symbiont]|uniref:Ribosome maturation factor RimM n=1 Tax=Catillopecten margaritatus gill symbiont TaxID=3083288 RepID=A0AAU6PHH0_9GAMM
MSNSNSKRLLVGTINGLFGVQGWVKIFSHTEPRKNILTYKPWYIEVGGRWQTLEFTNGREQGKTIVAKIKDIDDREQARELIGIDVYIEKSQLPKLEKGEYYWEDLIGLEVIGQSGFAFGKVENLMDTGANHVIVVRGEKEHWIPYIKPFLIETNLEKQQILVDWDENF